MTVAVMMNSESLQTQEIIIVQVVSKTQTIRIFNFHRGFKKPGQMQYSRDQTLDFVREVFSSYQFQSKNDQDKAATIEKIVNHPLLISNRVTKNDVLRLHQDQINHTTGAFNQLMKDPFVLTLMKSRPQDALSLCQVNPKAARVCRDPNTFKILLRAHYPSAFETDDPKNQYAALANGLQTTYILKRDPSNEDQDTFYEVFLPKVTQIGPTQKPWLIPGWKRNPWLYSYAFWARMIGPGYIPEPYANFARRTASGLYESRTIPPDSLTTQTLSEKLAGAIHTWYTKNPQGPIEEAFGLVLSMPEVEKLIEAGKITESEIEEGLPDEYRRGEEGDVVFRIKGNRLPSGTKAWLLIWLSHTAMLEDTAQVYRTREELAVNFSNQNFDRLLDILIENFAEQANLSRVDGDFEMIHTSAAFNEYLKAHGIVSPFTRETLANEALRSDRFYLYRDSERDRWLFREVTF